VSQCTIQPLADGLRIEGQLRIDGIVAALRDLQARFAAGNPPSFVDLGGVSDNDSSAVALMLELRRMGLREIRNMPRGMQDIVRACQLEGLLQDDSFGKD